MSAASDLEHVLDELFRQRGRPFLLRRVPVQSFGVRAGAVAGLINPLEEVRRITLQRVTSDSIKRQGRPVDTSGSGWREVR